MYLTTENAKEYLGKTIDCHRRFFNYYPLTVKQWANGRYYYVDRNGTAMAVPEPDDLFNRVSFDFVC